MRVSVLWLLIRLSLLPAIGAGGFYLIFWRASGRGTRVPRDRYLREPPDDSPPAVVAMLFAATPGTAGVTATLLDLARRGIVRLHAVGDVAHPLFREDTRLELGEAAGAAVRPFERRLLALVFLQERRAITVSDLRDWWIGHGNEAERWYAGWWRAVTDEMIARGLYRSDPRRWLLAATLYGMAFAFASVLTVPLLGFGALTGFATGMVLSVLAARRVSPLSPRGAALRCEYLQLRNYLRDFGRLDAQPPEGVVLWDKYLPLALVLGEGETALQALDLSATASPITPWASDPVDRLDLGDVADGGWAPAAPEPASTEDPGKR